VRSLYDTSSFFNCVAHFNPSPGSAPVSSLSLSSSRSNAESKANPCVRVAHVGHAPFKRIGGERHDGEPSRRRQRVHDFRNLRAAVCETKRAGDS
jgi:hypothetical protein